MSATVSFPVLAGAFALCVFAGAIGASITLLLTSDIPNQPSDMLRGLLTGLSITIPVIAIAGLIVALPVERFLLDGLPVSVYLVAAIVVAGLTGYTAEMLLLAAPYRMVGATVPPAMVAGAISAGLWHLLVRKRKVSTHG